MRLNALELRRLELSLVTPLATASERHLRRPILLLLATTDEGVGRGECDALETARYSGESIDTAEQALVTEIVPKLIAPGVEFATIDDVVATVLSLSGSRFATSAIEMALIDAHLRAQDTSLATFLGASRVAIPAGATIGIGPIREVVHATDDAVANEVPRVKLKVGPGADVAAARAVRDAFPDVDFVVDANGSYTLADAGHRRSLRALDELGLAAIEQPLGKDDLDGHARLVEELGTPVLLDESIASLEDLDRAIDAGACSGICLKPARLGGILAARRARDRCLAAGLSMAIGGLFEAGLGRAAAIAVGALAGFDIGGDLGPSDRYFEHDIAGPHRLVHGMLTVPTRPGLGVELRDDVVDATTASSRRFPEP